MYTNQLEQLARKFQKASSPNGETPQELLFNSSAHSSCLYDEPDYDSAEEKAEQRPHGVLVQSQNCNIDQPRLQTQAKSLIATNCSSGSSQQEQTTNNSMTAAISQKKPKKNKQHQNLLLPFSSSSLTADSKDEQLINFSSGVSGPKLLPYRLRSESTNSATTTIMIGECTSTIPDNSNQSAKTHQRLQSFSNSIHESKKKYQPELDSATISSSENTFGQANLMLKKAESTAIVSSMDTVEALAVEYREHSFKTEPLGEMTLNRQALMNCAQQVSHLKKSTNYSADTKSKLSSISVNVLNDFDNLSQSSAATFKLEQEKAKLIQESESLPIENESDLILKLFKFYKSQQPVSTDSAAGSIRSDSQHEQKQPHFILNPKANLAPQSNQFASSQMLQMPEQQQIDQGLSLFQAFSAQQPTTAYNQNNLTKVGNKHLKQANYQYMDRQLSHTKENGANFIQDQKNLNSCPSSIQENNTFAHYNCNQPSHGGSKNGFQSALFITPPKSLCNHAQGTNTTQLHNQQLHNAFASAILNASVPEKSTDPEELLSNQYTLFTQIDDQDSKKWPIHQQSTSNNSSTILFEPRLNQSSPLQVCSVQNSQNICQTSQMLQTNVDLCLKSKTRSKERKDFLAKQDSNAYSINKQNETLFFQKPLLPIIIASPANESITQTTKENQNMNNLELSEDKTNSSAFLNSKSGCDKPCSSHSFLLDPKILDSSQIAATTTTIGSSTSLFKAASSPLRNTSGSNHHFSSEWQQCFGDDDEQAKNIYAVMSRAIASSDQKNETLSSGAKSDRKLSHQFLGKDLASLLESSQSPAKQITDFDVTLHTDLQEAGDSAAELSSCAQRLNFYQSQSSQIQQNSSESTNQTNFQSLQLQQISIQANDRHHQQGHTSPVNQVTLVSSAQQTNSKATSIIEEQMTSSQQEFAEQKSVPKDQKIKEDKFEICSANAIGATQNITVNQFATNGMTVQQAQAQAAAGGQQFTFPDGGWVCSQCQNYNFSGRSKCNRCHKQKSKADFNGKPKHLLRHQQKLDHQSTSSSSHQVQQPLLATKQVQQQQMAVNRIQQQPHAPQVDQVIQSTISDSATSSSSCIQQHYQLNFNQSADSNFKTRVSGLPLTANVSSVSTAQQLQSQAFTPNLNTSALVQPSIQYSSQAATTNISNNANSATTSAAQNQMTLSSQSQKENSINLGSRQNEERVGDWVCMKCANLNFSFRMTCNRCFRDRNAGASVLKTQEELRNFQNASCPAQYIRSQQTHHQIPSQNGSAIAANSLPFAQSAGLNSKAASFKPFTPTNTDVAVSQVNSASIAASANANFSNNLGTVMSDLLRQNLTNDSSSQRITQSIQALLENPNEIEGPFVRKQRAEQQASKMVADMTSQFNDYPSFVPSQSSTKPENRPRGE